MNKLSEPIIYKGMTANHIAALYDDTISIPDFYILLRKNRELAKSIRDKLHPIQNIPYGKDEVQKLDIYAPKGAANSPVLIDIHGGGWVAGSKDVRSLPAEAIMSQGIIWVPLDYGLAPTYRMEEIILHIRMALVWVYDNIKQFGGEPNKIYISGQSAGAHLAATALMPSWQKSFNVPGGFIKGLIASSGIYDLCSLTQSVKTETQEILQLSQDEAKNCSPFYHMSENAIPIILAYGDKEPFGYCKEATDYANKLEEAHHDVSLIVVPDANHFDMINEIGREGLLFKSMVNMILK